MMNFFSKAYGFDFLSLFLLFLGLLFNFSYKTRFITLIIAIVVLYRAFSTNHYKRNSEEVKFESFLNRILMRFGKRLPYPMPRATFQSYGLLFKQLKSRISSIIQYKKQYKILKCPNCKQKLRVPRKQGKIIVSCKRCKTEFKART